MIRLKSVYDSTVEGCWKVTDKPCFSSGKVSWKRSSYYLSKPYVYADLNKFSQGSLGHKPLTIGAKCLTVWSK